MSDENQNQPITTTKEQLKAYIADLATHIRACEVYHMRCNKALKSANSADGEVTFDSSNPPPPPPPPPGH